MTTPTHRPRLDLPPDWIEPRRRARDVLVAAHAPGLYRAGFTPTVELRRVDDVGPDLPGWRDRVLDELAGRLRGFEVEDDDLFEIGSALVVYHRWSHLIGDTGSGDVICEQWSWLLGGGGLTLSCSVGRTDYADYCDLFEEIAESVELGALAA